MFRMTVSLGYQQSQQYLGCEDENVALCLARFQLDGLAERGSACG